MCPAYHIIQVFLMCPREGGAPISLQMSTRWSCSPFFFSSSSFHLCFLNAFLLTPLPPLILFLLLPTPADFLPTEICLCQHLAYPEAV